jgi:hypothetical protein
LAVTEEILGAGESHTAEGALSRPALLYAVTTKKYSPAAKFETVAVVELPAAML